MRVLGTLCGILLIVLILVDGFETILQPRRVTHRFRYARLFYQSIWRVWRLPWSVRWGRIFSRVR